METWREKALEAFPELRDELTGSGDAIAIDSIFFLLARLLVMTDDAVKEGNIDLLQRIDDYTNWVDEAAVVKRAPEGEYKPFPVEGFLVVRSGQAHIRQYLSETAKRSVTPTPGETLETTLQTFWETLGVDPIAYWGMGRKCLEGFDERDWGALYDGDLLDRAGRLRLLELVGDDLYFEQDSDGFVHSSDNTTLLASVEEAEEVRLLLDTPTDWEAIGVSKLTSTRNTRTLGFDIGWWADEYYSLISDCMVAPVFHGPYEEDWAEVASQATALNQHLLFDTAESATQFRDWYTTKDWAETEDGCPFIVIRIDSAS